VIHRYNPGACAVRWAIPLAAIAALDAATLAALAFILASRHVKLQPEPFNNGSLYKGKGATSLAPAHSKHSEPGFANLWPCESEKSLPIDFYSRRKQWG
jgi:hypothetical protein